MKETIAKRAKTPKINLYFLGAIIIYFAMSFTMFFSYHCYENNQINQKALQSFLLLFVPLTILFIFLLIFYVVSNIWNNRHLNDPVITYENNEFFIMNSKKIISIHENDIATISFEFNTSLSKKEKSSVGSIKFVLRNGKTEIAFHIENVQAVSIDIQNRLNNKVVE